jgi:hypothetical protein
VAILPKLFRRLAEFLDGGGTLSGFTQFLANRSEGVTVISSAHFTHFDTVVDVQGTTVRLKEPPENLMFEGRESGCSIVARSRPRRRYDPAAVRPGERHLRT